MAESNVVDEINHHMALYWLFQVLFQAVPTALSWSTCGRLLHQLIYPELLQPLAVPWNSHGECRPFVG